MTPRMKIGAAGVALILATNAIAISGALYNRGGEPDSRLVLSERELQRPYAGGRDENSGMSLRLQWRLARETDDDDLNFYNYARQASWLDRDKLAALGFDVSISPDDEEAHRLYHRQVDRNAFLVLEQDGPARAAALRIAEQLLVKAEAKAAKLGDVESAKDATSARKSLSRERDESSRLFVVDSGPDPQPLREKYPDASQYAIVRGHVSIAVCTGEHHRRFLCGRIADLEVPAVNVPFALRPVFESDRPAREPRYTAEIAFGRRLEPWLVSAGRLDQGKR